MWTVFHGTHMCFEWGDCQEFCFVFVFEYHGAEDGGRKPDEECGREDRWDGGGDGAACLDWGSRGGGREGWWKGWVGCGCCGDSCESCCGGVWSDVPTCWELWEDIAAGLKQPETQDYAGEL